MSTNNPQQQNAIPNQVLYTCPLLSANSEYNKMCVQDRCAWYMKATKTCAVSVIAHESVLNIKKLQAAQQKPQNHQG